MGKKHVAAIANEIATPEAKMKKKKNQQKKQTESKKAKLASVEATGEVYAGTASDVVQFSLRF